MGMKLRMDMDMLRVDLRTKDHGGGSAINQFVEDPDTQVYFREHPRTRHVSRPEDRSDDGPNRGVVEGWEVGERLGVGRIDGGVEPGGFEGDDRVRHRKRQEARC